MEQENRGRLVWLESGVLSVWDLAGGNINDMKYEKRENLRLDIVEVDELPDTDLFGGKNDCME